MGKELSLEMRRRINKVVARRYQKARKGEKSKVLDEFVKTTGYNRAYASWLLRNLWRRVVRYGKAGRYIFIGSRRKSQRGSRKRLVYYDEKTVGVLKRIWVILDAPCGKRLAAYIKYILPVLEKNEEIVLDKDRRKKLLGISAATIDRLLREEKRFPFPVLGIDSDNGSEFINKHLQKYCEENRITFTRARAYKKNDNCYVEQKNWSIVRRAVGYLRYETVELKKEIVQLQDNKLYNIAIKKPLYQRKKNRKNESAFI